MCSVEARDITVGFVIAHQPVNAFDAGERRIDGAFQLTDLGTPRGDLHEGPEQRARADDTIDRLFHTELRFA